MQGPLFFSDMTQVHSRGSEPDRAKNHFRLAVHAPRLPDRGPHSFPIQRFHVRDPALVYPCLPRGMNLRISVDALS
jgi:hypothetical protein